MSVKASKEESKEQSNNLKEEVIARLEKTSADIAEVEGRTETSIGAVYGNIETTEEKHAVSIAQLSDSLVVSSMWIYLLITERYIVLTFVEHGAENRVKIGGESSLACFKGINIKIFYPSFRHLDIVHCLVGDSSSQYE